MRKRNKDNKTRMLDVGTKTLKLDVRTKTRKLDDGKNAQARRRY